MEKKINFSDKSVSAKIVYAAVIAILCITAIVIGIVSAANKSTDKGALENPSANDSAQNQTPTPTPKPDNDKTEDTALDFIAPVAGAVIKDHSLEMPVFSTTLGEWRVHTGIDISCGEGADVFASEAGVVTGIYSDPMLGYTVEITHSDDLKTRYSNLDKDACPVKVGDSVQCGDKIGSVGDTSISELAEEPHLHFEVLLGGKKVNPLDYISEEAKKSSLGIA